MRKLVIAMALFVAGGTYLGAEIASDRLLGHIKFLASDELKGRGNGTEGLERAADYIAAGFKDAGLEPGGKGGSWFQPFELVAGLTVGRENGLTIEQGGKRVRLALGSSYYPLAAPANENPDVPSTSLDDVPLVFAGYGLVAPSIFYDASAT